MWILTHVFFAETFQPMNAAVTFQIGLNESARAIRGKFTFAGAWESCCRMRTDVILSIKPLYKTGYWLGHVMVDFICMSFLELY